MSIELWHCHNSRSLRVLWALEEMQIPFTLHNLAFPPRFRHPEFIEINNLGTVPYLRDDTINMTESCAILVYLANKYGQEHLTISCQHADYGDYLNWLFQSDATLTFPLTLLLRYGQFESQERQQPQVVEDYTVWFLARLKRLNEHLVDKTYLVDERFTIADIAVGYSLYLGQLLGLDQHYKPQTKSYWQRLQQRPAFMDSVNVGASEADYFISKAN
ncbi:glutathione S-transferase family protein [Thalassotalea sp. HSM 43]|uniref:glutathione S-transferase family protein n=1 Tax=Thalassotalea sp. HSM 43 TaxID=2552945 RepID=UPI001E433C1F|nr:glutathione S-transferase family protein [Thalassotalea sp. HSM 43]